MKRKAVLVIDDDPIFRALINKILVGEGIRVLQAETAAEAEDLLGERPDIIIVDELLPDARGSDWIRQQRGIGNNTPFILASALWHHANVPQQIVDELNLAHVVHKPIIPSLFREELARLLGTRGEENKLPDPMEKVDWNVDFKILERTVETLCLHPRDHDALTQLEKLSDRLGRLAEAKGRDPVKNLLSQISNLVRNAGNGIQDPDWTAVLAALDRAGEQVEVKQETSVSTGAGPHRRVVLTVTDDRACLETVNQVCEIQGLLPLTADSATRALIMARQTSPHLALIDLETLGTAGFELGQRLRMLHNPQLPLVFIFDEKNQAALEGPVPDDADYLPKPLKTDLLEDLMLHMPQAGPNEGANILIVDDDRVFLHISATILEGRGFRTTLLQELPLVADELDKALTAVRPDLILLDVELGELDGFDVCRRIRTLPNWQMIPILFLSGHNDVETRVRGLRVGGDDYIGKPVVGEELVARIDAFLERQQLLQTYQKAMDQLERSHENLYSILNTLHQGVLITNEQGVITFVNETCRRIFNLSRWQTINRPWQRAVHLKPEDRSRVQQMCRQPASERKRLNLSVKTERGPQYRLELSVTDNPTAPGGHVFYFSDISELVNLRRRLQPEKKSRLVGISGPMNQLRESIIQVARGNWTVTIEGETGVGKELVARTIHENSPRADKPFIPVNCAGLNESLLTSQLFGHKRGSFTGAHSDQPGLFQAAHHGTLFLDEFGEIPLSVQTGLLRALQEGEVTPVGEVKPIKVDVRVIVATNRDLSSEVSAGRFREDLFYRVRVARIQVPPLRERLADIPVLVSRFLEDNRGPDQNDLEISTDAMTRLHEYDWPGNVRELQNAVQFALIHCNGSKIIQIEHLPPELTQNKVRLEFHDAPVDSERDRILSALAATNGNRSKAARLLGIGRATLYRKIAGLGIA
ncbi:MAG: sigma 54-interacting transcriptional regulator [Acidobacteriota bacterium]|nr:sigma 54-interacting transcriptional regulator [Acidobacteriota bacterium]